MKLSDATFKHLFDSALRGNERLMIISVFTKEKTDYTGEYKLIPSVYNELMQIARKVDPDYDSSFSAGEEATITISLLDILMYTRLAGDPEPYAPDEEFDFDAIGEWIINLQTKEVSFFVDVTT